MTGAGLKKSLNSLREKPDKDRWISTGTTVNAFYSAILNSVSKYIFFKYIMIEMTNYIYSRTKKA